jgi:hypothetical protein
VRRQDDVNSAWDLAVVCLGSTLPARGTPAFVVSAESHLDQDPAFQGPRSQLMTAGYGGPGGVIVEATMPIVEAFEGLHWMGVDLTPSLGQSGAPMFHLGKSPSGGPEYRLLGVVSAEDRKARNRTIGALITDRTAAWIESAQETHRKVKRLRRPGDQEDPLLVRLHYPA